MPKVITSKQNSNEDTQAKHNNAMQTCRKILPLENVQRHQRMIDCKHAARRFHTTHDYLFQDTASAKRVAVDDGEVLRKCTRCLIRDDRATNSALRPTVRTVHSDREPVLCQMTLSVRRSRSFPVGLRMLLEIARDVAWHPHAKANRNTESQYFIITIPTT